MNARSILFAALAAAAAGSAAVAAEPVKAPKPESAGAREASAPVLMASADVEHAANVVPATAPQGTQVPVKRRTARVTTCRCADTPNQ